MNCSLLVIKIFFDVYHSFRVSCFTDFALRNGKRGINLLLRDKNVSDIQYALRDDILRRTQEEQ